MTEDESHVAGGIFAKARMALLLQDVLEEARSVENPFVHTLGEMSCTSCPRRLCVSQRYRVAILPRCQGGQVVQRHMDTGQTADYFNRSDEGVA